MQHLEPRLPCGGNEGRNQQMPQTRLEQVQLWLTTRDEVYSLVAYTTLKRVKKASIASSLTLCSHGTLREIDTFHFLYESLEPVRESLKEMSEGVAEEEVKQMKTSFYEISLL